jgi:polysaccharide export outer membrane protein
MFARAIVFMALCTVVHSCGNTPDPAYTAAIEATPGLSVRFDELASTDCLEIRVAGEPELSGQFTVSSTGTINYPWIGEIVVSGLTCSEIESYVTRELLDGYLRRPSVSCQVTELNSRRVDVIGQVVRPGSYPYRAGMTVLNGVAEAGGFTDDAAENDTAVLRVIDGTESRIEVPMDDILEGRLPNFPLVPGDTIIVPRYVLIP